jgi:hypothetical protein
VLLANDESEEKYQSETKIPGKAPGIEKWYVIMRVKEKVGDYERTERGEEYSFAGQICRAAKKEGGNWREVGPIGGGAREGVGNPVKSDGQSKD